MKRSSTTRGSRGRAAVYTQESGCRGLGLFTGPHIFLDGTFAVFNHLVSFENDQGRLQRPWFVEAWHSGAASMLCTGSRFIYCGPGRRDGLVAGPYRSHFAWATFERTVGATLLAY